MGASSRHDKALEDDALGEWASYEAPYHSGWTGAGGDGLQHLGVGFDSKGLKPEGGRAGEIALRRERLERKYGKTAQPGEEPSVPLTMEDQLREVDERKRRREQREADWSGADEKGRLVAGRGRRALRWVQAGVVLGVAFGLIGSNVLTSPSTTPPLKSKPLTYGLSALPFLSLALSLYLFAIRPCLYRRRSIRAALAPAPGAPGVLSVIPLLQSQQQQSRGRCCGRRGGKPPPGFTKQEWAMRQRMGGQPTVNLLVDAAPFAELLKQSQASTCSAKDREKRRRAREKRKRRLQREARRAAAEAAGGALPHEEGQDAWGSDTSLSSSDSESDEEGDDLPTARERQVAMHKWTLARRWAKKVVAVDIVCGVVWVGAVGAAIYLGGTCPSGGYDGWCNYYNLGLAMAVLSGVASWASATLGVVDLHRCKVPPLGLTDADIRGHVPWA